MHMPLAISHIENALKLNESCTGGLLASTRVFCTAEGFLGAPEILALIYADDLFGNSFWYGHILRHENDPEKYVALLVWSTRFVNAATVPLLFERFHHWMRVGLEYQPCAIQAESDAYAEVPCFEKAVDALVAMIERFEWNKRSGYQGSEYQNDRSEMRIMGVYGSADMRDRDGVFPMVPNSWGQPR